MRGSLCCDPTTCRRLMRGSSADRTRSTRSRRGSTSTGCSACAARNEMKVQLLVSERCMPWRSAEEIWRTGGAEKGDRVRGPRRRATGGTRGHREARRAHGAVEVIDGALAHLGVPSLDEAMRFVAAAPDRAAGTAQSHYVGLTLEATSGWQLASAAVYLALAGAALAFGGGI